MRRRAWIVGVIAFVLMAGAALFFHPGGEPTYNGRKLSEWLERYSSPDTDVTAPPEEGRARRHEAAEAVRHIGPKALPCLLQWLAPPAPTGVTAWIDGVKNFFQPKPIGEAIQRQQLARMGLSTQVGYAVKGFEILGTNAAPAIPELTRIIYQTKSPQVAEFTMSALSLTGMDGLPPLLSAWTNTALPQQFRDQANEQLAQALPMMRRALTDRDPSARARATNFFRRFYPAMVQDEHANH